MIKMLKKEQFIKKKIHCLIWSEINNYTGKTKTIAKFES